MQLSPLVAGLKTWLVPQLLFVAVFSTVTMTGIGFSATPSSQYLSGVGSGKFLDSPDVIVRRTNKCAPEGAHYGCNAP